MKHQMSCFFRLMV